MQAFFEGDSAMKKSIAMLTTALLCLAMLGGCGKAVVNPAAPQKLKQRLRQEGYAGQGQPGEIFGQRQHAYIFMAAHRSGGISQAIFSAFIYRNYFDKPAK